MFSLFIPRQGRGAPTTFPGLAPLPTTMRRSSKIGLGASDRPASHDPVSEIRVLTIPQETDIGCRPFPLQEAKKEQNCSTKEQNHTEKEQSWSAGRRTDATGLTWPSACKRQVGAERASGPAYEGGKFCGPVLNGTPWVGRCSCSYGCGRDSRSPAKLDSGLT